MAPTNEMLTNDGVQLEPARQLDELRAWFVGADHDDGLGIRLANRQQRHLHRGRIALVSAFGDQLHATLFHRLRDAREPGATEGVVLVQDGDPRHAEIIGEVLDPGLRLLVIRAANVDHIAE